jgi:Ca-activated chloride channel family protein
MLPALQAALNNSAQATDGHNRIRQVVFVTDGSVSNETALFQTIQNTLGDSRLFTVGIGSAPNSYFMRKAAEFGRGSFTYISKLSEVQPKMSQLFKRLSSPVVDEIALQWPDGTSVEVYPARIPTLYLDEPLLITFKRDRLDGQLQISGKTAGKPWRRILTLSGKVDSQGISTLWARAKIEGLLDQKIAGADETKVRPQVLAVALKHQLVSPYTSFVAVEKTPARQLAELMKKVPVANLHPEGTSTQSYAIPKTATGADITILVGALLMLLAWVVRMIDLKVKARAAVVTCKQGGLL